MIEEQQDYFEFVRDYVRNKDHYLFLTCSYADREIREFVFALYAINFELAKILSVTSNLETAAIRLKWWGDAIDAIYLKSDMLSNVKSDIKLDAQINGQLKSNHELNPELIFGLNINLENQHQIMKSLSKFILKYRIEKKYFDHIFSMREFDLALDQKIRDIDHLREYTKDILGNILRIMAIAISHERNIILTDIDMKLINKTALIDKICHTIIALKFSSTNQIRFIPSNLLLLSNNVKAFERSKFLLQELISLIDTEISHTKTMLQDYSVNNQLRFLLMKIVIAHYISNQIKKHKFNLHNISLNNKASLALQFKLLNFYLWQKL